MLFIPITKLISDLERDGYSLNTIANMAGCSCATISRIKRGICDPTLNVYLAILGVWETRVNRIGDQAINKGVSNA
jgi:uncharacterized protein YerC